MKEAGPVFRTEGRNFLFANYNSSPLTPTLVRIGNFPAIITRMAWLI